ncbi:PepSY domain-containing protein [Streptomyces sp. HU2014]|uniref:PepSY domain-containing protein n=1 Tax=Streptomyces sp. HU2014 TaxID=2939414 RepID=UPI00200EFAB0|nr:PepSY domain-containing protein [Streptomyces sp. HU2014]UQI46239.1 PepSY domain-containing protein [Streptomyces sp. HU2014]
MQWDHRRDARPARRANRWCAAGTVAAAMLVLTGCGGDGDKDKDKDDVTTPPAATSVSPGVTRTAPSGPAPSGSPAVDKQRAEQAAQKMLPGSTVASSHLDTENGRTVWEVRLKDPQGTEREVDVDAATGEAVLSDDVDESPGLEDKARP